MGCCASTPEIDYGAIAAAKEAREMKYREQTAEMQDPSFRIAAGFNGLNQAHETAKKALANLGDGPKLTDQVEAVKSVAKKATKGGHHLKNVFAAPLTNLDSFTPPVYWKGEEEEVYIAAALKHNFVFSALSERELKTIIDAFEKIDVASGDAVITQGEQGDYFYVIKKGNVHYEVDGKSVGKAKAGQSFGELALLYTSPRAATVIADEDCVLYRVDQKTFRYIMQSQTVQTENAKKELLEGVTFLQDLDPSDIEKLITALTPRKFIAGENIVRKGEQGETFYVIQEGKVIVSDISIGKTAYEDQVLGVGEYFGERALITKEPRSANVTGRTKGILLAIDRETFETLIGNLTQLVLKSQDKRKLSAIKVIQKSHLFGSTLAALAADIVDEKYAPESIIMSQGLQTPAALYLVREGQVEVKSADGKINNVIESGGYFGEDMLSNDVRGLKASTDMAAKYTATVLGEEVVVGVLTLEKCRLLIDTTTMGKSKRTNFTSIIETNIPLENLKKHAILGAGTFGQVWLVSKEAPDGTRRPYALKIQSKYELVENAQAKGVVTEKNIMEQLNSPFVIQLAQTYQDDRYVYMLLGLVQGGELFSLLHQEDFDGISEKDAKFYAAGILEGLSYMHRRHILYRDLKPENVLIDNQGYPVIVDLGFAKYVPSKTYTLCGTPLYLAPEVILNRGHDKGADHWSFAVLVYEMIAGYTPFYTEGMDQISLFRYIVKGGFQFPKAGVMSPQVEDLIGRLLVVEPRKRLGSLALGIDEIFRHIWFDEYDFAGLRRKEMAAPWEPTIVDPLDKSNFENWDHLEDKTLSGDPIVSASNQEIFESF